MTNKRTAAFLGAVAALGEEARTVLGPVGEQEMALAGEIRLRVGAPAVLSLPAGQITTGSEPVTRRQMDSMVLALCGHSVYSHQQEIIGGYISLPGGHRAGVCGRAVLKDGSITAVRDITSICLRIARDHSGCARRLADRLFGQGLCSAIIAGAPSSGKTTMLRDIARLLAGDETGRRYSVAAVDERGELSMGTGGLSAQCDVLSGYPKSEGIMIALRSLSPDVIICDEIGDERDIRAVEAGVNAGVHMLCSVHAGSADELGRRPQLHALLGTGAFRRVVLLDGRERPGTVKEIIVMEDVYEMACGSADNDVRMAYRQTFCGQASTENATA